MRHTSIDYQEHIVLVNIDVVSTIEAPHIDLNAGATTKVCQRQLMSTIERVVRMSYIYGVSCYTRAHIAVYLDDKELIATHDVLDFRQVQLSWASDSWDN